MADIIVPSGGSSGTNGWIIATMLAVLIIGIVSVFSWNSWGRSGDSTVINVTGPAAVPARETEINIDEPAAPVDPGIVVLPDDEIDTDTQPEVVEIPKDEPSEPVEPVDPMIP